jgi:acetylornithine/succinyldiaminopimelate/putrescine aminotransferase
MVGIELAIDGTAVVKECLARKLLVNCTHNTVIRLLPAMNLPEELAEEGCEILSNVIRTLPRPA